MKNDIIITKCDGLTNLGYGICKNGGQIVFVKNLLPNEQARIKIIKEFKTHSFGIVLEYFNFSSDRTKPFCDVFGKCGGCDFCHITYEKQKEYKINSFIENFKFKHGLDIKVNSFNECEIIDYRNKAIIPIKNNEMGFFRQNSHDIINFNYCHIQTKLVNEIVTEFKKYLSKTKKEIFRHLFIRHFVSTNEVMLGYVVNYDDRSFLDDISNYLTSRFSEIKSIVLNVNKRNDNVILNYDYKDVLLFGKKYIIDKFEHLNFKVSFKSFYQVNSYVMRKLYNKVKEFVNEGDSVLDLYSGIGTIGMFVADKCKKVIGVEIIEDAVKMANDNVKLNDIKNAQFYCIDVANMNENYFDDIDCVIIDPPRKGLDNKTIELLKRKKIKKMIYVSCNPNTLARDLKIFSEFYKIENIDIYDMFSQTTHVETVCLMTRVQS